MAELHGGDRWVAKEFYDFGSGDTMKRLYWAQRRMQEQGRGDTAQASPVERLERKYVNLPSPPFQDADGTLREGAVHAVEIVQLWKVVPSHGGILHLVK